jgi:phage terminase large subunit
MTLTVPEILVLPPKLNPILTEFDNYQYFLIDGGRGGGKSQAIGRFILYLCEFRDIRVVCGRETQNSITESVYSIMADLITKYNLNFEIQASKIIHRSTGSMINFRGFREQGRFNIQGMEGVDVLWIDEAQAITKDTLASLIPTIRKDNSKVIFTMNRHVHNDPAYINFCNRSDCLHIHINYDDNPFCTEKLKREAIECRKLSESDYNHIWLGVPLSQSEDCVFGHEELMACKNAVYPIRPGYDTKICGVDIARYGDDKCAVVTLTQMGALHWEVSFVDQWGHTDLNTTTGRILITSTNQNATKCIIDEDGIGAGPLDTLNKGRGLQHFVGFRNPALSYQDNKFYGNNRTKNVYKLKDMILAGHICIRNDDLLAELETLRYTFDHNQRRILISKDKMRKDGVKSPNLADALIMAVSLIGEIKDKQDNMYRPVQRVSADDNLFGIAGVR